MALKNAQKRYLRGLTHGLNPVVMVAERGLAPSVLKEMEIALDHHELIKVKINVLEREDKQLAVDALCEASGASVVQMIGKMALLYRPAKKPNPKLSNLLRFQTR